MKDLIRVYLDLHGDYQSIEDHPQRAMEVLSQKHGFEIIFSEPQGIADQWMFITTPFDISKYSFLRGGKKEPEAKFYGAEAIYQDGLEKVKNTPPPEGQKFLPGQRVRISRDGLGWSVPIGSLATVEYTSAHAYGGKDIQLYSLIVDDHGSVAWFHEDQLEAIVGEK